MSRNLIIYHRVDFDGIMSGCIVKKYYTDRNIQTSILGWNYSDKLPNPEDLTNNFDTVIMVDISFPPEIMKVLRDSGKLIWIDHHHSSIKNSIEGGYTDVRGIRENGTAACELTWQYFFQKYECPIIIQLLGAYDVWDKDKFDWNNEVLPLQFELRGEYGLDFHKIFDDFEALISGGDDVIFYLLEHGMPILKYLKSTWEGWIKAYSFPVKVAGKYNGICILSPMFGSSQFESVAGQYDISIVANKKGNSYSISFYKEPGVLPNFNLANYMKSISPGGGGHASACGGTITLEQFIRLINDQEI